MRIPTFSLLPIVILPLVVFTSITYNPVVKDYQCLFLKNARFKNKTDTISIKAAYLDMGKVGQDIILKSLEKDKALIFRDFKYAIGFQPVDCSNIFYVPSRDEKAMSYLVGLPKGSIINLKCIIFESYDDGDRPFFIINKVHVD